MEKKNKKKLFAIIGASALAFVLTIALSVSITLAYFGNTANGNTTITLGQELNVNTSQQTNQTISGVLPGQKLTGVSANATVLKSSTKAFLIAIVDKEVTAGSGKTIDNTVLSNLVATELGWVKIGTSGTTGEVFAYQEDGYLSEIDATAEDQTIPFLSALQIPAETVNNNFSLATLEVSVRFIVVQSSIPTTESGKDANGDGLIDNHAEVTFTDAQAAFNGIHSFAFTPNA